VANEIAIAAPTNRLQFSQTAMGQCFVKPMPKQAFRTEMVSVEFKKKIL